MTATQAANTPDTIERKPRDDEIDVHALTHTGKVRKSNNDHFLLAVLQKRMEVRLTSLPGLGERALREQRLAWIMMVADGVGGSETGEEASRMALETVTEYLATSLQVYYESAAGESAFREALQDAASRSHATLLQRAQERADSRRGATTLTLFLGVWPWAFLLQLGDSRYYRFREGELTQITRDQTYAQDLIDQGALTPEQAKDSRLKNVLSSAIGGEQAEPAVTRMPADWRNVHLLCSDGLTKHVSDDRIRQRLSEMTTAKGACEALLKDALDDGGTDNITLMICRTTRNDRAGD